MTLFVADVSSAQSGLTMTELQRAGICGVIIKATEGASYRNPLFPGWLAEAQRIGMLVAAYHFTHPVSQISAAAQAANIAGYVPHDVPVFMDDEAGATLADGHAIATLILAAHETVAGDYNWARPASGAWWRAAYLSDPSGPAVPAYQQLGGDRSSAWVGQDLWQYCQHGDVPGFSGEVDFSAYRGTLAQLTASGWFWAPTVQIHHSPGDDMLVHANAASTDKTLGAGSIFLVHGQSRYPVLDTTVSNALQTAGYGIAELSGDRILAQWPVVGDRPATVDVAALEVQLVTDLTPHLAPGLDPAAVAAQLAPLLHPGATVDDIKALLATLHVTVG